jgi:hypothetical protein
VRLKIRKETQNGNVINIRLKEEKHKRGRVKLRTETKKGKMTVGRYNDSLRTGPSGDRITVRARFSAPVQTGPEAHPVSYAMGTGSFLGVKRPGRGVDHPTPSSADVKERVELYLYTTSGPSWPVLG